METGVLIKFGRVRKSFKVSKRAKLINVEVLISSEVSENFLKRNPYPKAPK